MAAPQRFQPDAKHKPEPKMMNICDCMGVLSISGCDQD
jgi:hypothetical protein